MDWVSRPDVFLPIGQQAQAAMNAVLLTSSNQVSIGTAMQREIRALDSSVPVSEVESVDQRLARVLAYPRFRAILLGAFAGPGTAAARRRSTRRGGQFVAQRTKDIGVRMAIGARTVNILLLIAKQAGIRLRCCGDCRTSADCGYCDRGTGAARRERRSSRSLE